MLARTRRPSGVDYTPDLRHYAAAYSVFLIVLVCGAVGVISVVAGRVFRTEEGVDMALGAG
jgi:hypothetical protein